MASPRIPTGLSGILAVDKPSGMTSHDVVALVRRFTGERRVGHAGTLDPLATGLLVVLVGPATRLAPYLSGAGKRYTATVRFGAETDTDDADGATTATSDVPSEVTDHVTAAARVAALVGSHEQIPPAYSAIKVDGRTGYQRARSGEDVTLPARTIHVRSASLLAVRPSPVEWDIDIEVTKGTYIRSVARDLGRSLGTHAHLSALRRTAAGTLSLDDAITLESLEHAAASGVGPVAALFADPIRALALHVYDCDDAATARVAVGAALSVDRDTLETHAIGLPIAVTAAHRLLAIYETASEDVELINLRPRAIIPGGVAMRAEAMPQ